MPYTTYMKRNEQKSNASDVQISSKSWGEPRRPLPYFRARSTAPGYWSKQMVDSVVSGGSPSSDLPFGNVLVHVSPGSAAYAAAYDRLYKTIGEKASLALTLMDRKKSCDMIAARAMQIVSLVRKAKMGKLPKPSKRASKRAPTNAASAWLEYTFGWVPLIQDIGSAVEVMQSSPPVDRVRGRANVSFPVSFDQTSGGLYPGSRMNGTASGGVSLSCQVIVTNPDLYLANQLGFVNPAFVAWDAIPFSFVIDWFLPVGKFLSQFTNEVGLELRDCATTRIGRFTGDVSWWGGGSTREQGEGRSFLITRSIGPFVSPGLLDRIHIPTKSLWLAATSVSLAIQQLQGLTRRK